MWNFYFIIKPASELHYSTGRQGIGALLCQGSRDRDNNNLFCLISTAGSTSHAVSSIIYADEGESDKKLGKKRMDYLGNTETILFYRKSNHYPTQPFHN